MKRAKYIVLLIIIFVLIAIGVKTIFSNKEKSIDQNRTIVNTNDFDAKWDKNAVKDSITQDTIVTREIVNQGVVNENANELNLRFFDELTGYAVVPEYVEIKQREDGKSHRSISSGQISKNGSILKRVANGVYDITVSAVGYLPMKTFFDLKDQKMNIHFNLVPINPPKELSDLYIQSLHKPDIMVIVGCIVDDLTGNPLTGVEVYTADKIGITYSNENGFFQLNIPLSEEEQQVELRGTIYFKLNNYITEVRQKFDMWSNGDAIFKIRMTAGSGLNSVSVLENRQPSREIKKRL